VYAEIKGWWEHVGRGCPMVRKGVVDKVHPGLDRRTVAPVKKMLEIHEFEDKV
jgi:hypothetical protein